MRIPSQKEFVERVVNVIDKEGEVDDDEGDEIVEEVVEYDEGCERNSTNISINAGCGVELEGEVDDDEGDETEEEDVMNSPTGSDTKETLGNFSNRSFVNRAAGLNFFEAEESINIVMGFKDRAYVYGAASVDYSRIGTGPVRDADLEARRFEKVEVNHDYEGLNMVETVKELVEGENGLIDDVVVETVEESDVVENGLIGDVVVETVKESVEVESGLIDDVVVHDEKGVVDDEMLSKQENSGHLQLTETLLEQEIAESEVLEIDDVDFSQDVVSVQVVNDQTDVILDDMWSKQEHTHHLQRVDELQEHESAETEVMEIDDIEVKREVSDQLLTADFDQDGFGEDMNVAEKVIGDIKPSELASFDAAVTVLTGLFVLLLTSICAIYQSKRTKSTPPFT
ncbi:hypothetical protein Tco_1027344, partial [Tanacetum coccineum]